ncbi:hypothetical protein V8G54_031582 [Vigna mungo]|uniref:Uncharacterized protein n=1 Tax=Vigna mungo TaxID=3915 RepID=A0AAQ3MKC6_VIGMU
MADGARKNCGCGGECGNWALWVSVETGLCGPPGFGTKRAGLRANVKTGLWANMEIGLSGPIRKLSLWASKLGLGARRNWALGASVETGLSGNWAYGPGELGLRASVETGLRGQASCALWASVETRLMGQCRNLAYGPSETGLWGPVRNWALWASVETGLSGSSETGLLGPAKLGFVGQTSWALGPGETGLWGQAKTRGEIHKFAPVFSLYKKTAHISLGALTEVRLLRLKVRYMQPHKDAMAPFIVSPQLSSNQLDAEIQMQRTDSSWGSHDSQIGSITQVASLHNPSISKLHSDPGIGPHSIYA